MSIVQLAKDSNKFKTTWLLPKDLVRQTKQYALDHDTNATAVVIQALREFLDKRGKR